MRKKKIKRKRRESVRKKDKESKGPRGVMAGDNIDDDD